ncbi:MAG: hypothetical protein K6E74_03345 [Bacilli bacterium]|nr:hypothetical protein [Bacilli bacterium]
MKLRKFLLVLVALVFALALAACKKDKDPDDGGKKEPKVIEGTLQEVDEADIYDREDYTSVYDKYGASITIADVTENADGSATITKDGKTYTLGLDFLSMAMVYNCAPAGSFDTEEKVYNQWWKLYIQRWNKVLPEVPLYSNQYFDVFAAKIGQFKTSPYWGAEEAIVGATSTDGKVIMGNSTDLSGLFRASSFGKSSPAASDQDIEQLTTGYSTVISDFTGTYSFNEDVVKEAKEEKNEDGSVTYTIEIKPGLKDSKNREITADYYIASTIAANTPIYGAAGGSKTGSMSLVGYKNFLKYDGTNAAEEGVDTYFQAIKKFSEYKWSVTIDKDYATYYYRNTYAGFSPKDPAVYLCGATLTVDETTKCVGVSADYYETETKDGKNVYKNAEKLAANIRNNSAEDFAFTGPYVVKEYDKTNKTATLEKNQYYVTESYRKFNDNGTLKDGNVTTINYIKVVEETSTDKLKAGELNILTSVTGKDETEAVLELCKDKTKFDYCYYDRAGYGKLSFKGDYGPTQFQAVRQAIAYTINRPNFVAAFTGGYGILVDGPYYVGSPTYLAVKSKLKLDGYDYDTDAAKKLLEDDGWIYSFDAEKKVVTEYTGSGVRYKKLAENEQSEANIFYSSTDNAYKTIKYGDAYYMPLVINWFATPADENDVTALLITSWKEAKAPTELGFYITCTQSDFITVLYGEYYQMEAGGYSKGDRPNCSCANFATGYNSAAYDYAYSWTIDQDLYWDYNTQLMDPADFWADYQ